jgi:NADH:ubiquinone oxidoreductase subunit 6 (subunit J)
MGSKALKVVMLVASTLLLVSAFVPVRKPNPPRSLMLLGSGLVLLAGLTRRHYADEK